MSIRTKAAKFAIAGAAMVAVSVFAAESAFAAGPTYGWQYGSASVDNCINHTSGGTAVGGWAAGQFVANSNGGGSCGYSYVTVYYLDNAGNPVGQFAYSAWGSGGDFCGASCIQIILSPSDYTAIREVVGSSDSGMSGMNTGNVALYY